MQMVACLSEEIWGQLQEESAPCLIVTTGFCTPCGAAATLDAAVEPSSSLGRLYNRIGHMLFQLLVRGRQKCEAWILTKYKFRPKRQLLLLAFHDLMLCHRSNVIEIGNFHSGKKTTGRGIWCFEPFFWITLNNKVVYEI